MDTNTKLLDEFLDRAKQDKYGDWINKFGLDELTSLFEYILCPYLDGGLMTRSEWQDEWEDELESNHWNAAYEDGQSSGYDSGYQDGLYDGERQGEQLASSHYEDRVGQYEDKIVELEDTIMTLRARPE